MSGIKRKREGKNEIKIKTLSSHKCQRVLLIAVVSGLP
jgi:hypothetical protein